MFAFNLKFIIILNTYDWVTHLLLIFISIIIINNHQGSLRIFTRKCTNE